MVAEEIEFVWKGLTVQVGVKRNWSNLEITHLEIRCVEPIPITETGYRSHFMPQADLDKWSDPKEFVLAWLEDASASVEWKRIWDARQQFNFQF